MTDVPRRKSNNRAMLLSALSWALDQLEGAEPPRAAESGWCPAADSLWREDLEAAQQIFERFNGRDEIQRPADLLGGETER